MLQNAGPQRGLLSNVYDEMFGPPVVTMSIDNLEAVSFPSNYSVGCYRGNLLITEAMAGTEWDSIKMDLFVCAEQALEALSSTGIFVKCDFRPTFYSLSSYFLTDIITFF